MKKVWAVLLAAALLLAMAAPVMADRFETWGKCGENLTWSIDNDMVILTISGTGEMYDWKRTDDLRWGGLDLCIQTVDIKTGVTSIGNWAFQEFTNLKSINIPDSVTRIGDYALAFCRNLQTINISEDNQNYMVVEGILFNSDATTLLRYPAGATATGYTIPDTVTSIGSGAFYGCGNLENISVSNENQNFTVLDGVLFNRDATTLLSYPAGKTATEYTIPNGVTSIGNGAFYSCTNLVSVSIPNSVTSIGDNAFAECDRLTDVTIPDGVTSIGDGAFAKCDELTSVTIPNSVTSIGDGAFSGCTNLSVSIPDGVTRIGDEAFSNCYSLTSITIPKSVLSIGNRAFYNCNLVSVSISDGVESIGDEAFSECGRLTSISIPDSVTSIGKMAFPGVKNIHVSSGNPAYSDMDGVLFSRDATILFCYPSGKDADADAYTTYTIPDSVTSIGDGAFVGCYRLTGVTIPDGVTSIGDQAFWGCRSLTSVSIPDGVTSIGDGSFFACDSLTSVTIPNSVTSIGDQAFGGCGRLESITIPDGVTSIGDEAFYGCSSLTSITIPDGVTSIGDRSFTYCASLTSITIPDGVTTIGVYAFDGCSSLTSVTIPVSVTSIGVGAFMLNPWGGEDDLTDVYYNGTENQWNAIDIGSGNDPLLNATIHFNGGSDPEPVHTHTLTHHAAQPADCTQDGNVEYWYCADCGKYFADAQAGRELGAAELTLPALGHDWGEWLRVKEPTETAYGRKTRTCARCGASESVLIQMLPSVTPETPTQPPQPSPEPHAFADVPESEWYVEAVNFVWDKGLMQGVSETEFAPDATADRAMLVTILHRMAEEPEAAAAAFADVDADAWFAAAVAWASETGVVSGYEDGLFHPNQPITREQLVTMLWRMAGKPEADPLETGAADWAAEAMSWAIGRGVILGDGSGYSPRRTATRAEVAAILMRCDQL